MIHSQYTEATDATGVTMEPFLTIKDIDLDKLDKDQTQLEEYFYTQLRGQGAAYDHIGFSWVQTGKTWTLYGYGWWNYED